MKKNYLLLMAIMLYGVAGGQESQIPITHSADSNVAVKYHICLNKVQGELSLFREPVEFLSPKPIKKPSNNFFEQHSWRIGADITTFLRDAAFSLPYTRGYTATGFFVSPYAQHRIGLHAQMTLGVHLAGVAGFDGFRLWKPLVRLEYEPFQNVRWIMGSLYGGLNHRLFEPMYDRERNIYDRYEEGVQLLAEVPLGRHCSLSTDTWLNWEELLEPWQMRQERFTLGSSNQLLLFVAGLDALKGISLSVPFSFLGTHCGGQFTGLDTCIQSLFNENVGLRIDMPLTQSGALALDVPFFFYQDISPEKWQPYNQGWGFWPQISYGVQLGRPHDLDTATRYNSRGSWRLLAQAGYWYGCQFIAPKGSYLFQSVSWHKADLAVPEREMITGKVAIENLYTPKFSLGMDAEFYYDLYIGTLDFAFGIYMRYRL